MASHKTQVLTEIESGTYFAKCSCRQSSGEWFRHRWQAEDWVLWHQEQVELALAHLHRSTSLKQERDWAKRMLDDPQTPPEDLASWQVLYDGAAARLRDHGDPDPAAEGLW